MRDHRFRIKSGKVAFPSHYRWGLHGLGAVKLTHNNVSKQPPLAFARSYGLARYSKSPWFAQSFIRNMTKKLNIGSEFKT